jgi:ABC-type transport system involved in cytochrome c biogenesis permease subunit
MKKWIPWILAVAGVVWIASSLVPQKPKDGFDLKEFGQLPVLLSGRVQPFDSVGRNALLVMSGKSQVRLEDGKTMTPTEWLLEAMTRPEQADQRKIFRAQHPEVEHLLGTQEVKLQYYCFNDVTNHLAEIERQARELLASEKGSEEADKLRTPYQKDLMHLYQSIYLYGRIKHTLQPDGSKDFAHELEIYKERIAPGLAALKASEAGEDYDKEDLQVIAGFFQRYQNVSQYAYALTVPPKPGQPRDGWKNIGASLMESIRSDEIHPAATHLASIVSSYQKQKPEEFNRAVADYQKWLKANSLQPEMKKGHEEFYFNQAQPFYKSMIVYVAALILGCCFWLNMSEGLRRCAVSLLTLAFVIHTAGLLTRMYLEGRPPVTNLYSSAIFVGWGAVLFGLVLERIFRGGIGIVVASVIGFSTLIIAHHLSLSGDTMEMLRAVLDTNLWLSTHVVIITLGYASMFVGGLLAVIYIVRGFFTRNLRPEMAKTLTRMVYGILCFATLFSFVGTILGGIWGDQSWGRFWGWDVKENGALLIVLWTAVTLHARWGGLVRERGLMAMAVFGNIVTSFSWFGVNMLGVGLHSYGFMEKAFVWLVLFDTSQVLLILVAMMPLRYWASFRNAEAPKEVAPGGAAATA